MPPLNAAGGSAISGNVRVAIVHVMPYEILATELHLGFIVFLRIVWILGRIALVYLSTVVGFIMRIYLRLIGVIPVKIFKRRSIQGNSGSILGLEVSY